MDSELGQIEKQLDDCFQYPKSDREPGDNASHDNYPALVEWAEAQC